MVDPGHKCKLCIRVPVPKSSQFLLADKMLSWSAVFQEGIFGNGFSNHSAYKIWQPCWTYLLVLVLLSAYWFFHLYFMWAGQEIRRWSTGLVPIVVSMFLSHFYLKKHPFELNTSNVSRGHCQLPWLWQSSVWTQVTTQQTDIKQWSDMHLPVWRGLRKYDWKVKLHFPFLKFCFV